MLINKMFFSIYIKESINRIDQQIKQNYFVTIEDAYRAQGRLDLLKELYDEYNLEDVSTEDVEYRNDF